MGKYLYKKGSHGFKKLLRLMSWVLLLGGISIMLFALFPIISWQIYFQSGIASENFTISIPRANIVDLARNLLGTTDYTKAENWFTNFKTAKNQQDAPSYTISIPKINIKEANVSTTDTNLAKHLVNYQGTAVPGKNGNAVIFGHSTLPQLFNPKDYKTIFANAYKLKDKDAIYATVSGVTYTYKVFKIIIVDPEDSSALIQDYNDSYLTLVTCTPPGTIWKRLVVKARLERI